MSEVFQSGYGYDKTIPYPDISKTGWKDISELESALSVKLKTNIEINSDFLEFTPKEIFEYASTLDLDPEYLLSYLQPSDGFTDADFKRYIESKIGVKDAKNPYSGYRKVLLTLNSDLPKKTPVGRKWSSTLNRFFIHSFNKNGSRKKAGHGRDYTPFRLIELNEFFHNSKNDQTLEEYLIENSEEITELCESLDYKSHSPQSADFLNLCYAFTDFELPEIRENLLKMTLDKFDKVQTILNQNKVTYSSFDVIGGQSFETADFLKALKIVNERDYVEYSSVSTNLKTKDAITKILTSHSGFTEFLKENDYKASALDVITLASSDGDGLLDLEVLLILDESSVFERYSFEETLSFLTQINSLKFFWKNHRDLPALWYSLNYGLITPERLIELVSVLQSDSSNIDTNHYAFSVSKVIEKVGGDDMPIEWSLSLLGVLD